MSFVVTTIVLASAVADDGTVTFAYPSGYTQASFTGANASATGVAVLDNNLVIEEGDPGIGLSYGASLVTLTNLTGVAWPAGATVMVQMGIAGNDRPGFQRGEAISDVAASAVTANTTTAIDVGIQLTNDKVNAILRALRSNGIINS